MGIQLLKLSVSFQERVWETVKKLGIKIKVVFFRNTFYTNAKLIKK